MKSRVLLPLLLILGLTACSSLAQTPTPLPTVQLDTGGASSPTGQAPATSFGGGVTASGVVATIHDAHLALTASGIVKKVAIAVGDEVNAGDILVELDQTSIQIAIDSAQRNLREMTSPAAIAAAEQALATTQQAQKDAQSKAYALDYPRASDTRIKNIEGQVDLAKQDLARASDAYHRVENLEDGDPRKAAALVAMTNAQMNYNQLVANLNWYTGTPSEIDMATIHANLDAANVAVQEAQWYLSALKGGTIPAEATGSKLAALENARLALTTAQNQLDNTRLLAPISGMVISVNVIPGEYALPGQILVVINDVTHLEVQTTDLSERDVPNVKIGQNATITLKALNQNTPGHVTAISPVASTLGGDVVYQVTLAFDAPPPGMLAGMSVDVAFEAQ